MYYGGGGFIHSEVYNMPIWLRSFHVTRINDHHTKQNEEVEKASKKQNPKGNTTKGPNVNPSSTYNFKK